MIVRDDRVRAKLHVRRLRSALIIERYLAKVEEESLHKPAVFPIRDPRRTGSREQKFYILHAISDIYLAELSWWDWSLSILL